MERKVFTVASPVGMWDVAREVIAAASAQRAEAGTAGATVLALSGELGAGKTAFTQALAATLGFSGAVQSPTFVIMKKHALPAGSPWHTLAHIDAYRLGSAEDLPAIGWGELVVDPGNLVVVEWPERVAAAIPAEAFPIAFAHESPTVRLVTLG
jgi:tRNA threonylcarbamoyladenosine biosynthesis protein TsaE